MVAVVVATTADPASVGPASALLAMPGWYPGPPLQDVESYVNREVRVLKLHNRLVQEDHLDKRWEEATGESVDEVIFLSTRHILEGEALPAGGKPGWAAPPNPRIGPWLRLLRTIAVSHNLTPEFEVTSEATHHGPITNSPTLFVKIGSTAEYWIRQDAAQAIAVWQGLGLGGGNAVGDWTRNDGRDKILIGIGGGHYEPGHMDIVVNDGVWVGHLLSGYSLLMEDPGQLNLQKDAAAVGGTWRDATKAAFEATESAFPGGEVIAHLDNKLVRFHNGVFKAGRGMQSLVSWRRRI